MSQLRIAVIEKPVPRVPTRLMHVDDVDEGAPGTEVLRARFALARREHEETVATLRAAIASLGLDVTWFEAPLRPALGAFDRLISVGGDGTFLLAARLAGEAVVLGVNSSPSTSVGRYCATETSTLAASLAAIVASDHVPARLLRLRVTVDGAPLPHDALNDALFANACPVSATRYALITDTGLDVQLSSGIWVATPTGSSGAIRSAGGALVGDMDGRIQWRVREPFFGGGSPPRAPRCIAGFAEDRLEILSRHDANAVFLDGHPEAYPVPLGARVAFRPAPTPLLAHLPVSQRR